MANAAPIWGTGTWGDFLWKTWGGTATVATATAGSSTPVFVVTITATAFSVTANGTTPSAKWLLTTSAFAATANAGVHGAAEAGSYTVTVLAATATAGTPNTLETVVAGVSTATADGTSPSGLSSVVVVASAATATCAYGSPTLVESAMAVTAAMSASAASGGSMSGSVVAVGSVATATSASGGSIVTTGVVPALPLTATSDNVTPSLLLVWNLFPTPMAATGGVNVATPLVSFATIAAAANAALQSVVGKFFTIIGLPFGAIAPQSLQRGYNGTGWDTNYVNTVMDPPVSLTGWTNPRRASIENSELNEVFDSLEQYLAGTIYADNFAMDGHKVEFKWDAGASEMRLIVDGVDLGHLKVQA